MSSQEAIDPQQTLLDIHRRTLETLLRRAALHGGEIFAPPDVIHGIHEARSNIRHTKDNLRILGGGAEDHPDDDPPDEAPLSSRAHSEQHRLLSSKATPLHNRVLAERSDPFSAGMIILRDLMVESPDIRRAAHGFSGKFRWACEQLEILHAYKSLHDQLHELQFRWYNPVMLEALDFPHNATSHNNLRRYLANIESVIKAVQAVVNQSILANNKAEWLHELRQAQISFQSAIETNDRAQLKRATELVWRVLVTRPPRINDDLIDVTTAMRLPILVAEMNDIYRIMIDIQIDEKRLKIFKQAVHILEDFSNELAHMIEYHSKWQRVDSMLRRIEDHMEWTIEELFSCWPDLRLRAEPLYAASTESWAVLLRDDSMHLATAMSDKNPTAIKQCFRNYRAMAGRHFYEVDIQLKDICEQRLRQAERQLAWMVGALE